MQMAHTHTTSSTTRAEPQSRAMPPAWKAMLIALVAIAIFILITEHRAHLLGAAPYLLAIIASLFCMLGHRHGGHGRGGER